MMNKILKWVMLTGRYLFLCFRGGGGERGGGCSQIGYGYALQSIILFYVVNICYTFVLNF